MMIQQHSSLWNYFPCWVFFSPLSVSNTWNNRKINLKKKKKKKSRFKKNNPSFFVYCICCENREMRIYFFPRMIDYDSTKNMWRLGFSQSGGVLPIAITQQIRVKFTIILLSPFYYYFLLYCFFLYCFFSYRLLTFFFSKSCQCFQRANYHGSI